MSVKKNRALRSRSGDSRIHDTTVTLTRAEVDLLPPDSSHSSTLVALLEYYFRDEKCRARVDRILEGDNTVAVGLHMPLKLKDKIKGRGVLLSRLVRALIGSMYEDPTLIERVKRIPIRSKISRRRHSKKDLSEARAYPERFTLTPNGEVYDQLRGQIYGGTGTEEAYVARITSNADAPADDSELQWIRDADPKHIQLWADEIYGAAPYWTVRYHRYPILIVILRLNVEYALSIENIVLHTGEPKEAILKTVRELEEDWLETKDDVYPED